MGVMLLGKIKIYEIAKKLNLTSKEVLEMAKKLNIDAKSHMSGVDEEDAKKIEKNFDNNKKQEQQPKQATNTQKKEEKAPVIIRREVIITDEEKNIVDLKNDNFNGGGVQRQ